MCQTFIHLLDKDGRIVNVSSVASSLDPYSDDIRRRFRNPQMTLQDLDDMMAEYLVCYHFPCNLVHLLERFWNLSQPSLAPRVRDVQMIPCLYASFLGACSIA